MIAICLFACKVGRADSLASPRKHPSGAGHFRVPLFDAIQTINIQIPPRCFPLSLRSNVVFDIEVYTISSK